MNKTFLQLTEKMEKHTLALYLGLVVSWAVAITALVLAARGHDVAHSEKRHRLSDLSTTTSTSREGNVTNRTTKTYSNKHVYLEIPDNVTVKEDVSHMITPPASYYVGPWITGFDLYLTATGEATVTLRTGAFSMTLIENSATAMKTTCGTLDGTEYRVIDGVPYYSDSAVALQLTPDPADGESAYDRNVGLDPVISFTVKQCGTAVSANGYAMLHLKAIVVGTD